MKLINIRTILTPLLLISTRQRGYLRLRGVTSSLLAVVLAFQVQLVAAATLQIQFTGLGIEYNGSLLTTGGNDPLNTVTLLVDGLPAGATLDNNIFVDLSIAVSGIPTGGGAGITTNPVGSLDLSLGTGSLGLTLNEVFVNYLPIPAGFADVVFASASASIDGQDLPYGLVIGDTVTLSFSTQITRINSDSNFLTSFTAAGTGEISGIAHAPVPPAVWLFSSGLIGLAGFAKCKKAKKSIYFDKRKAAS